MRCNPTQVGADPASPGGYAAGFAQIGLGIGCCRARVARPAQQTVSLHNSGVSCKQDKKEVLSIFGS